MDFMIIVAVTADVMFAAMACGTSEIRIPWRSRLCMAAVSSGFLLLSAAGKSLLFRDFPQDAIRWIGFDALVCIGLLQIFGTQISLLLEKTKTPLLSPVRVGAAVFLDHTRADSDHSKILSVPESIVLASPVSGIHRSRHSGVHRLPDRRFGHYSHWMDVDSAVRHRVDLEFLRSLVRAMVWHKNPNSQRTRSLDLLRHSSHRTWLLEIGIKISCFLAPPSPATQSSALPSRPMRRTPFQSVRKALAAAQNPM